MRIRDVAPRPEASSAAFGAPTAEVGLLAAVRASNTDVVAPMADASPAQAQERRAGVEVALDVIDAAALEALAEVLGSLAADLWLEGKLDV